MLTKRKNMYGPARTRYINLVKPNVSPRKTPQSKSQPQQLDSAVQPTSQYVNNGCKKALDIDRRNGRKKKCQFTNFGISSEKSPQATSKVKSSQNQKRLWNPLCHRNFNPSPWQHPSTLHRRGPASHVVTKRIRKKHLCNFEISLTSSQPKDDEQNSRSLWQSCTQKIMKFTPVNSKSQWQVPTKR